MDNLTNTKTQRIFSSVPCIVNGFEGRAFGCRTFYAGKERINPLKIASEKNSNV